MHINVYPRKRRVKSNRAKLTGRPCQLCSPLRLSEIIIKRIHVEWRLMIHQSLSSGETLAKDT